LKEAGAVIIGKTNLHEFAYGVTTINPHYGTARNPWDRERICGGSSGGSASAVALGMGLASLGSDTGGSIRIPASFCGIVGLKPTYGRVSLRGVIPLSWSLDHGGPMTRTVEDAAMLMEIIGGADVEPPRYVDALTAEIKGVRIGIPKNHFYEQLAPPVASALHAALRHLEKLGAETVDVEAPDISIHRAVWLQIASPEAYSYHEFHLQKHADLYGADVRGRLEAGRALLSIDFVRAQRARSLMKENCKRLFERVDVIVTPTTPVAAPRIEEAKAVAGSLTRCTRFFNIVGLPAISIPCGFTPEGLPIGMQIAGKAFDEFTVLRVAHAYEQDAMWFERRPAV
jgi:aspartyl-tRNA(Asn)/glutamyl-tRNA(Gln) amidotransferase subunit A